MEYGRRSEEEPFNPSRYWQDKLSGHTSKDMLEASKRRARLFSEASNKVHGHPPALTAEIMDVLINNYPSEEMIKSWLDKSQSAKTPQPESMDKPLEHKVVGSQIIQDQTQGKELSEMIKDAADKFERAGGWGRFGGGND